MRVSEEHITELRESFKTRRRRKSSRIDLTGLRFGRLEVIEEVSPKERNDTYWVCKCDCGFKTLVDSSNVRSGRVKSCGCLKRQNWATDPDDFMYQQYKNDAKQREIEFSLSKELFIDLINQNCRYCNCPPSQENNRGKKWGPIIYTGIDRIDSDLGYITDNVVPCCEFCNRAKLNLGLGEFYWWLDQFEMTVLKKFGVFDIVMERRQGVK